MSRSASDSWIVRAGAAWLSICIAATGLGCAGTMAGLSLDEVSDTPIAFVYWAPEAARRRQEIMDDARSGGLSAMPRKSGVATADGVAALFGRDPASLEGLQRHPGRIAFLNPRTGELERFGGSPANARPLAWSNDRTRILFTSSHLGEFQIYEFDLESSELRTISRGPALHLEADYGPEGQMIMTFVDQRGGRNIAGMVLADTHGANAKPLIDASYPSGPRFSPSGDHIVWVRAVNRPSRGANRRDASAIVVQPPELSNEPVALTRGREPSFLPDGSGFVYTSETEDGWRLHRMRVEGGGRARIGGSIRDERNPAVSPDGRHVVYVSPGDDGIERLYIRRIDGSGDRILLGEGAAAWPVW